MKEIEAVTDEVRRAFEGAAWHGPALFEVLDDFTPEQASQRTFTNHTVWEIGLHVAAWVPVVLRRLQGEAVELEAREDWPPVRSTSPEAWKMFRSRLDTDYRRLLDHLGGMTSENLRARIRTKEYDAGFMLHGLAQHVAYHTGQIAQLQKATADPSRGLLRHTLATLAYRGAKAIRGAPPSFSSFRAGERTRTAVEILSHLGDLLDWSLSLVEGGHEWRDAGGEDWQSEAARFHDRLAALDRRLSEPRPLGCAPERLFQGPIADALSHVGQIAMLRGMAGSPVRGENYFKADIEVGVLGPEQAAPRVEFE